ncbi:hypothetical protein [Limimaricola pyoseonensis]|uniref:Cytochrome c oxidase subunit 3 n=1 Tax=Limimaricola pyoseonensis TaxID=521013 RepID=A0A1G7JGA8_9RHOB|nr:hypothetical protein [Limimaricola pyoseonensis]SDF23956.1 cytochrome c oxidase subunit 3 [Limimaricola pyoseonensis]
MTVVLGFIAAMIAAGLWWLSRQGIFEKPWLETGESPRAPGPAAAPSGVGLGTFLVVVGGLFALMGSALVMRMGPGDWMALRLPGLAWGALAPLALASAALEIAARAERRGEARLRGAALGLGALATAAFLAAQLSVWRDLAATGPLAERLGASFFLLIGGLHALHLAGGLVALARAALRPAGARLCALYWHALGALWLVMLALLGGAAAGIAAFCRAVLT